MANCNGGIKPPKTGGGNVTFCGFIIDGYESAKRLCDLYYMSSPELILEELNGEYGTKHNIMMNVMMASSKVAGGEMFSFLFSYNVFSISAVINSCWLVGFFFNLAESFPYSSL